MDIHILLAISYLFPRSTVRTQKATNEMASSLADLA
jgi:hypothetical protein